MLVPKYLNYDEVMSYNLSCERYVEGKKSPVVYFLIPHMKRAKKVEWEDLDLGKV